MATDVDLAEFQDKKVIIIWDQGAGKDAVEIDGTAEKANALGVVLKPRGKTAVVLIEASEIVEIREKPEDVKPLERKPLKPVILGQARSHLLERHGYLLADVNKMTENAAFHLHSQIDHEAEDLGHFHLSEEPTSGAA